MRTVGGGGARAKKAQERARKKRRRPHTITHYYNSVQRQREREREWLRARARTAHRRMVLIKMKTTQCFLVKNSKMSANAFSLMGMELSLTKFKTVCPEAA